MCWWCRSMHWLRRSGALDWYTSSMQLAVIATNVRICLSKLIWLNEQEHLLPDLHPKYPRSASTQFPRRMRPYRAVCITITSFLQHFALNEWDSQYSLTGAEKKTLSINTPTATHRDIKVLEDWILLLQCRLNNLVHPMLRLQWMHSIKLVS